MAKPSEQRICFNVNEIVRVRLTEHGRKIHRERYRKFNSRLPLTAKNKYTPPREDSEGWSRWQLWALMEIFGEHCGLLKTEPFEGIIEFVLQQPCKDGQDPTSVVSDEPHPH